MKNILILLFPVFVAAGCDSKTLEMASSAMEPTIKKGDRVTVDFGAYESDAPKRWDVVAYDGPNGKLWIHRVVGLPGEKVYIGNDGLFINKTKVSLPPGLANADFVPKELMFGESTSTSFETYEVPNGAVFLLGDNGKRSFDSRINGPVLLKDIKARASF